MLPASRIKYTLQGAGDIWRGLYEVPLWEVDKPVPSDRAEDVLRGHVEEMCGVAVQSLAVHAPVVHKLTHRDIVATYVAVTLVAPPAVTPEGFRTTTAEGLSRLPVSRLMERLLAKR